MRLRSARPSDHGPLLELGRRLNSINLATDAARLERQIAESQASFRGERGDRGMYLFVLEGEGGRAVGSAMILAKHGTPEEPHYYLQIDQVHRHSDRLGRDFASQRLFLKADENGPTEIGGLILDPARRGAGRGRALSLVRFLYMAAHPERFQKRVLAEMKGWTDAEGRSPLWERYGRRITGLELEDADLECTRNKDFIRELFVEGPLYTALMPEDVRATIRRVPPETEPALAMLLEQGMQHLPQIDPFDGGPYIAADLADLAVARSHRRARLSESAAEGDRRTHLSMVERGGEVFATCSFAELEESDARLPEGARRALGAEPGETIHVGETRGAGS